MHFASIALCPSVHNKRSRNTEEAERVAPCRSGEGESSSHHDLHPMGGLRASPLSRPETPASSAKKQVLQLSMLTGRPVDIAGWHRPRVQGCIPCPLSEPQSPHLASTPGCCTRWAPQVVRVQLGGARRRRRRRRAANNGRRIFEVLQIYRYTMKTETGKLRCCRRYAWSGAELCLGEQQLH